MKETTGYISSIESMGLVDGPGIRFVVFMQGCALRCKYCHNPETWAKGAPRTKITPSQLVDKIDNYINYFGEEGGVTFSGGEPLLQPKFLLECLKLCKAEGINTALDTAGVGLGDYDEILNYTDLVILDIKAVDEGEYKFLTGATSAKFKIFLDACQRKNKRLWLRQVIVPGINDTEESVLKLKEYASTIKNVEKIELLPYETLGVEKYKTLKLPYHLEGVPPMNADRCKQLEKLLK